MITIDKNPAPDASAWLAPQLIGDAAENVLIVSLPQTTPADVRALLGSAAEITDEQPQTITRYRPKICYNVAGEGGRTYAKLRIAGSETTENPAYYAAQTAAATAENSELLSLLGETVNQEYLKAMEEINHV